MTRQNVIFLILGFLLCFCLLGKQVGPDYDLMDEPTVAQNMVIEDLDSDKILDVGDDVLVMSFFLSVGFLFRVLPIFLSAKYRQPFASSPQRPPRHLFIEQ
jgi:hypothetical protein